MANSLVALGVNNPEINALGAFSAGQNARQSFDMNNIAIAQKGLETVGSIALGSMGGDIDGQADPAIFEQGLDFLEKQGVDVKMFRGRSDMAPAVARSSMTALQQLQQARSEDDYNLALKRFDLDVQQAADTRAHQAWTRNQAAQPKPGYTTLSADEAKAMGLDPNKVYQKGPDGKLSDVGGSLVTVNTGNQGDGAFFGELDKADGKVFADLIAEAPTIGRKTVQIDQLEGLLNNINSGGESGIKQMLGEFGIATEGLDSIQAAQALINQIVPEQRQPGSGPMSDADLALFKQSVPRIINQPGGNQMIIDTMKGINEYTRMQSEIAAQLAGRKIERDTARDMLADLPNPLDGYADRVKGSQDGGVPKVTTKQEMDALPSGTLFIAPDGTTRRKP